MIGLVNLVPESDPTTCVESLAALPELPALRWSGFLIRCTDEPPLGDVVQWCAAVRNLRPAVPLGIATRPDLDALQRIASAGIRLTLVLGLQDVPGGRVNSRVIQCIREASVEATIVERRLLRYGHVEASQLPVLFAVAGHAVRGERIKSIKTSINASPVTIARRLRQWGYPPPGVLLRDGRIASVAIRIGLRIEPRVAREAAGWQSAESYAKARRRLRVDAKWGGLRRFGGGGAFGDKVPWSVKRNAANQSTMCKVDIMTRSVAIIGTSIALALAVPAVAFVSTATVEVSDESLPQIGFPVHDTIRGYLPEGGTALLVSESCDVCLKRANAYFSTLTRNPDHILLVSIAEGRSVFEDLKHRNSHVAERVLLLSATDLVTYLNGGSFPTFVSFDDRGRVTNADPSTVGWFTSTIRPSSWFEPWRRLLGL